MPADGSTPRPAPRPFFDPEAAMKAEFARIDSVFVPGPRKWVPLSNTDPDVGGLVGIARSYGAKIGGE